MKAEEEILKMMKELTEIQRELLTEHQALELRIYILESEVAGLGCDVTVLETEIAALEERGLWSWLSRTAKSVARKLS